MKSRVVIALLLVASSVMGQPSYWFQGFQRQGNAQLAQQYFFLPGANMTFTFDGKHVILNSSGGGGGGNIQLFGDITAPLTALPNVTTTLKNTGSAGTYTKITFDAQGRETSGTSSTLASSDFLNQGTTATLLHGNAGGNPSWGQVNLATEVTGSLPYTSIGSPPWISANEPITLTGDVTGGPSATTIAATLKNTGTAGTYLKVTTDAQGRVTSGTDAILASTDFGTQGSLHTVLHGSVIGIPSWAAINLGTEVSGTLPVTSVQCNTNSVTTTVSFTGASAITYSDIQVAADTTFTVNVNSSQPVTNYQTYVIYVRNSSGSSIGIKGGVNVTTNGTLPYRITNIGAVNITYIPGYKTVTNMFVMPMN